MQVIPTVEEKLPPTRIARLLRFICSLVAAGNVVLLDVPNSKAATKEEVLRDSFAYADVFVLWDEDQQTPQSATDIDYMPVDNDYLPPLVPRGKSAIAKTRLAAASAFASIRSEGIVGAGARSFSDDSFSRGNAMIGFTVTAPNRPGPVVLRVSLRGLVSVKRDGWDPITRTGGSASFEVKIGKVDRWGRVIYRDGYGPEVIRPTFSPGHFWRLVTLQTVGAGRFEYRENLSQGDIVSVSTEPYILPGTHFSVEPGDYFVEVNADAHQGIAAVDPIIVPDPSNPDVVVKIHGAVDPAPKPLLDMTAEELASAGFDAAPFVEFGFVVADANRQTLIVDNGSGDGAYPTGTIVRVSADLPQAGQEFARWAGDIAILSNPFLPTTTAIIPSIDVNITATYSAPATYTVPVTNGAGAGSYPAARR